MTPMERAKASAIKWLKISIRDTATLAEEIQKLLNNPPYKEPPGMIDVEKLQAIVVQLRKAANRCAHHGLGMTVQDVLPLPPDD